MTSARFRANGPVRSVRIGGFSRYALLLRLQEAGVRLNEAARTLFADPRFTTLPNSVHIDVVEVSVDALGLHDGATFDRIAEQAASMSLHLAPLELGPHLRLQYDDQAEGAAGHAATSHRAPPGSVTVASIPLSDDDEFPRGFYLRRIDGALWLRGYRSSVRHIWSPGDIFAFACTAGVPA